MSLLVACSVGTRYRVLSFFFDGVPDPFAPPVEEPAQATGPIGPVRAPLVSVFHTHAPYAQRRCDDCHLARPGKGDPARAVVFRMQDLTALKMPVEELCVSCHAQPERAYEHAPALLGMCTTCHHPHTSRYPHLMLKPRAADLCATCHDATTLVDAGHEVGSRLGCSDCHDPHGGSGRFYLRDPEEISRRAAAAEGEPASDAAAAEPSGVEGQR